MVVFTKSTAIFFLVPDQDSSMAWKKSRARCIRRHSSEVADHSHNFFAHADHLHIAAGGARGDCGGRVRNRKSAAAPCGIAVRADRKIKLRINFGGARDTF